MKKFISVILMLSFAFCLLSSCGGHSDNTDPDAVLSDILKSYKNNGLASWWQVLAIYNAGENPSDYKGFEELYLSLEGTANLKMASYVIVANVAIVCGTDAGTFAKYEEYKINLKNLLENPSNDYTLNDYIFGYLALICSGVSFDESKVLAYLIDSQKADGGFSVSSSAKSGDVDVTAFAIPALEILFDKFQLFTAFSDISSLENAVMFLENSINENGAFSSYGSENANSTACALSALISVKYSGEIREKAADGLRLFKVKNKKETGYSFLIGGNPNDLATAQAAIALGDLKNKMSVWEKLYLDFHA